MRIAIHDEPYLNGCTFYRSHYPFTRLEKDGLIKAIRITEAWKPADFMYCDIVVKPRPLTEAHYKFLMHAKQHGVKVWIDTDDDFNSIPLTNPARKAVNPHLAHANNCFRIADLVTVSTDHLRNDLQGRFPGIPIITLPNVLKQSNISTNFKDRPKVFWRGSRTHGEDLEVWREIIIKAASEFEFHWFGELPFWYNEFPRTLNFNDLATQEPKPKLKYPCVFHHDWSGIYNYFNRIRSLGLNVMLYPLADNYFNRSKSNIAWQEATFAGAACITNARWSEWEKPGVLHDPNVLFDIDKRRIREAVSKSKTELGNYTFADRQKRLYEIAKDLMSGKIK